MRLMSFASYVPGVQRLVNKTCDLILDTLSDRKPVQLT